MLIAAGIWLETYYREGYPISAQFLLESYFVHGSLKNHKSEAILKIAQCDQITIYFPVCLLNVDRDQYGNLYRHHRRLLKANKFITFVIPLSEVVTSRWVSREILSTYPWIVMVIICEATWKCGNHTCSFSTLVKTTFCFRYPEKPKNPFNDNSKSVS